MLALLVVAGDAAESALGRVGRVRDEVPVLRIATRSELGRAVGRGEVALVGLTDAALAKQVMERCRSLPREREKNNGARNDPRRQVL